MVDLKRNKDAHSFPCLYHELLRGSEVVFHEKVNEKKVSFFVGAVLSF